MIISQSHLKPEVIVRKRKSSNTLNEAQQRKKVTGKVSDAQDSPGIAAQALTAHLIAAQEDEDERKQDKGKAKLSGGAEREDVTEPANGDVIEDEFPEKAVTEKMKRSGKHEN